jgi:hypothetical protein
VAVRAAVHAHAGFGVARDNKGARADLALAEHVREGDGAVRPKGGGDDLARSVFTWAVARIARAVVAHGSRM